MVWGEGVEDSFRKSKALMEVQLYFISSSTEPFSQYTVSLTASTSVGRGPSFNANYTTNEGGRHAAIN